MAKLSLKFSQTEWCMLIKSMCADYVEYSINSFEVVILNNRSYGAAVRPLCNHPLQGPGFTGCFTAFLRIKIPLKYSKSDQIYNFQKSPSHTLNQEISTAYTMNRRQAYYDRNRALIR